MISREMQEKVQKLANQYPFVAVTGPRQSGKSTLLRNLFQDYDYVSLEDLDERDLAERDPRAFIRMHPDKAILDEVQRVPGLLSYLQTHADEVGRTGMYILSGSQNFLLMEKLGQSLAGRVALLDLLPFSHSELKAAGILPPSLDDEIFTGGYPRIFDKGIAPTDFYPSYLRTYVERDLRTLKNVGNLNLFVKFLKLCAGRIGQLLNESSLANECGVSTPTINSWLSVLEASFILYRLRPDFRNFNKRLVKTPKIYFYDTGLACSLLEIDSANQLKSHFARGSLFENLVINEFMKKSLNQGKEPRLSFWRDNVGHEVDLIQDRNGMPFAYEIKSGETFNREFLDNLNFWGKISGFPPEQRTVVYAGAKEMPLTEAQVVPWVKLADSSVVS